MPPVDTVTVLPSWIWEIDFTNDPSSATETWTDITAYVRDGATIKRGRQVETGRDQAGTCSLSLDNRDRRFDWYNTAGPYYPGIKPMRRIRCRATYSAVTYPLFYGYLDALPMAYPGVSDAVVQITATDAFKVLANKQLMSPEKNLIANPGVEVDLNGYGAQSGATISRYSTNPLLGDWSVLLTVPGTATDALDWEPSPLPTVEPGETYTFSLLLARNQSGSSNWRLRIDWYGNGSFISSSTADFTLPGAVPYRYSLSGVAPATADQAWCVLRYNAATGARTVFTDDWRLVKGAYASGAYPRQPTSDRMTNVLDQIGWPAAARSLATGVSNLDSAELDKVGALEHLQQVAESGSGRFFIDAQGRVKFIDRRTFYTTSSQATFGENEILYVDVTFSGDDQLIFNEVICTRAADRAEPRSAVDAASALANLSRTLPRDGLLIDNDNECASKAEFELALYKDFHPRITSMRLDGTYQPSTVWPQALGRELGDRVTVRKRPPGGGTMIEQVSFIESIEHRVGVGTWETVFGLTSVGIGYQVYPSGKTFFTLGTSALTSGTGVLVY